MDSKSSIRFGQEGACRGYTCRDEKRRLVQVNEDDSTTDKNGRPGTYVPGVTSPSETTEDRMLSLVIEIHTLFDGVLDNFGWSVTRGKTIPFTFYVIK